MHVINLVSDDYILHIYTSNSVLKKNLLESKFGNIGQYSYRIDPPHNNTNGQRHLHGYLKGNEIFAINIDGSAHDGCHQTTIPQKFLDELPKIFKGVKIPENGLIESVQNMKSDSLKDYAEFCQAVALANDINDFSAKEEYLQWVLSKAAQILDGMDD